MAVLHHAPTAIAIAAVLWTAAAPALAGDAVKLEIEFPPDVRELEPGDDLDVVQVVGIDAAGARVGFGGRRVRLAVSVGKARVVEAPFRFGYTAPETIDGPTAVTFTATLDGTPAVSGTARLDVVPRGPYVRLAVESARTRVDWGESSMVTVQGENREGRLVPVVKGKVLVTVEGPGSVEFVRLGAYRYVAPRSPSAGDAVEARIVATIEGAGGVRGRTAIALGAPGIRIPPPKTDTGTAPSDSGETEPTTDDTAGPESGRRSKRDRDDDGSPGTDAGEVEPIAWPGGALGVLAWRARPDSKKGTKWRRVRKLPESAGEFAAPEAEQRIRALVLPGGDGDVRAEWRVGDAEAPLATPPGRLRVLRDRLDRRVAVIDATPPESGEPLRISVVVTTAEGDVRDELVLRRKTGGGNGKKAKNGEGRKKPREEQE